MPDWRNLHQALLREADPARLAKLTYELEAALYFRFQELVHQPGRCRERAEMRAAVLEMRAVRITKLGWPDPRDVLHA